MVIGVYSQTINGVSEYVLVSKGSDEFINWIDNILQLINKSPDMLASEIIAKKFVDEYPDNEITFVGHSKGGAEAAVNAFITNKNCITFNSAYNSASVNYAKKIASSFNYSKELTPYIVSGEILHPMSVLFKSKKPIYLTRKYSLKNPLTAIQNARKNHLMEAVKWGLANDGYK